MGHYTIAIYSPDQHPGYDLAYLDQHGVGGGITTRIRMAHALAQQDHDVTLYIHCPQEAWIEGVHYRPVHLARRLQADVIIASTSKRPALPDWRTIVGSAQLRILLLHGAEQPAGVTASDFDYLYTPSNFIRQKIAASWAVSTSQIVTTYRGIVKARYSSPSDPSIDRDSHRLVYASHPSKGLDHARAVLAYLRETGEPYSLHLFGGGALWGTEEPVFPDEPGVIRHGLIGQAALPGYLQTASFSLCLQDREEPFGMVVTESMQAGCIVIASPVGAYSELIRDGYNGFLVPGDPAQPETRQRAAALIQALANDPDRVATLRRQARATPLDWSVIADAWTGHWDWVLAGRPAEALAHDTCAACGQPVLRLADGDHCPACGFYRRMDSKTPERELDVLHRPRKQILIAGYFGFGNTGDEAILAAMLADLQTLNETVRIIVVSGDPPATRDQHGVAAIHWQDIQQLITTAAASDLLVLGGGGLFQDYWGFDPADVLTRHHGGLAHYSGFALLGGLLNKPVMLYAVGVGPLTTELGLRFTRLACEQAQTITVRNDYSRALLIKAGVEAGRIQVTADPAFRSRPRLLSELPQADTEPILGLSLRNWTFGVSPDHWEREIAQALDIFVDQHGGRLQAFAFHESDDPVLDDRAVINRIKQRMKHGDRLTLPISAPRPDQLEAALARCHLVLGMRLHTVILAANRAIPTVALVYDPKVRTCLEQLGLEMYAVDLSTVNGTDLAVLLDQAFQARAKLSAALQPRVTALAHAAHQNVEQLEVLLATSAQPRPVSPTMTEVLKQLVLAHARSLEAALQAQQARDRDASQLQQSLRSRLTEFQTQVSDQAGEITALQHQMAQQAADLTALTQAQAVEWKRYEQLELDWQTTLAEHQSHQKELQSQVDQLTTGLGQATDERRRLRDQRDTLLAERNELQQSLTRLRDTLGVRLVVAYWNLLKRIFPPGSRALQFYRRLLLTVRAGFPRPRTGSISDVSSSEPAPAASPSGSNDCQDLRQALVDFEDRLTQSNLSQIVLVFSATRLIESEGQRATNLALELARRGVAVVFCYWRWTDSEPAPADRPDDWILQLPMDEVAARSQEIFNAFARQERFILIEFPHPALFEPLAIAQAQGWRTVYDVVDDWAEFHRVGQAIWHDPAFEAHLLNTADVVVAVNPDLAAQVCATGRAEVEVIPNGANIELATFTHALPLARGTITVGYFGYLAAAWFDWELVFALARRQPDWKFYLIGYGQPDSLERLPDNLELLGRKPQTELAAYAANWDVAIVPFKAERLAKGADPIKIYEYLAMGLPVVVTGVYPPAGAEQMVLRAEGVTQFADQIRAAAQSGGMDMARRKDFAARNTWAARVEQMLATLQTNRQRLGEKRMLFGLDR